MRRLNLYDSRTRELREFAPIQPPRVGLYVCGLTPYAPAHVGHGRTFVVFDLVARALRRWGYRVFYVQNVTNLDDKLIARASDQGVEPLALADRHFLAYRLAMERLGVRSVNYYPFATDFVPEIVDQIRRLVERGFAYPAPDGSVYFSVAKFPPYGRLSGQKVEALRPGARIEVDERKRAPEDFVIWKAATPGEPSWESPWGPGRPGWHVEDTAMTLRLFGDQYDLHGAGLDLIFPHHEAEVALAESTTGASPLVRYWMHAGLVALSGEKMSKSVGNIVPLNEAIERHGAGPLRLYYLNAHYRSPLDLDPERSLSEAQEAYGRLYEAYRKVQEPLEREGAERAGSALPEPLAREASELVEKLDATLAEDFDTRSAIALLFGWVRRIAEGAGPLASLSGAALEELRGPFDWAREVLGFFEEDASTSDHGWGDLVQVAIAARARARARSDFAEADRIRTELASVGIDLQDSAEGTRWRARPRG